MAKKKTRFEVLEELGWDEIVGKVTRLNKGFPKPLTFDGNEVIYLDIVKRGTFYKVSIREENLIKAFETGKYWNKLDAKFEEFKLPKLKSHIIVFGKIQRIKDTDTDKVFTALTVWDDDGFRLAPERPKVKNDKDANL